MKKNLTLITVFLIVVLCVSLFVLIKKPLNNSPAVPEGKIYEVILTENGFSPSEITIKSADSIKFTTKLNEPFWPASDLHPTHGIYPEFDPQEPIEPTSSWTFQFLKTGRWKYHDHLQPFFRGVIQVQ